MEQNKVEYIQDIAFNDTCDRMVIATTSKQVITLIFIKYYI